MKKMIAVGAVLSSILAMAEAENKVPDVLTAISTRKSVRKFDASRPVEDPPAKDKWNAKKIHADRW